MSTKFESQIEALNQGFVFSGKNDLMQDTLDLILAQEEVSYSDIIFMDVFGHPLENQVSLVFKNCNDVEVHICSSKFRDGYDLWLSSGKNGFCRRV